jgi:hypothetical protein
MTSEERKEYLKQYRILYNEELKKKANLKYKLNRTKILASVKKYYQKTREKQLARMRAFGAAHPERRSVKDHYHAIVGGKRKGRTYKGMKFFDGWNPAKGGSFKDGEDWIINNLGKRPKGASLHIVDHEKGFVPGNLEWAYRDKQNAEQMFKIIAKQKHRIKELETLLEIERKKNA